MAAEPAALDRLEAVCARLEAVARKMGKGGAADDEESTGPSEAVLAFRGLMENEGKAFLDACAALPYPEGEKSIAEMATEGLSCMMEFVAKTDVCKKPSQEDMIGFYQARVLDNMQKADALKMTRKKALRPFDFHHAALFCTLDSLTWVAMYPPNLPAVKAKGELESADFHLNRILTKCDKTAENKAYSRCAKNFMKKQAELIKQEFKMGLEWRGTASLDSGAPAAAPEPVVEAAPEKVEKVVPKKSAKKPAKAGGDLFGELSKGLKVTSGLKKVKKTQRNKYSGKKIEGKVSGGPTKAKSKRKLPPPKKTKRGKTWYIEYYTEGLITLDDDFLPGLDLKMGIFISGCLNCNFLVPQGLKIKSVVLDGCKRVQCQVADIVSTVEIVNCQNCTLWCDGAIPSIQVDKCDSPKIVLMGNCYALDSLPKMIFSNVTAGNVEIPGATEDDDNLIHPIPEQFFFNIDKETGETSTSALEHMG